MIRLLPAAVGLFVLSLPLSRTKVGDSCTPRRVSVSCRHCCRRLSRGSSSSP
jgi:hypothetical protein